MADAFQRYFGENPGESAFLGYVRDCLPPAASFSVSRSAEVTPENHRA
jgi:hypothetical protein